jgi:hypothetical protein
MVFFHRLVAKRHDYPTPPNAKNSIFPILKTKPPRDPLVDFDSPNAVDC